MDAESPKHHQQAVAGHNPDRYGADLGVVIRAVDALGPASRAVSKEEFIR